MTGGEGKSKHFKKERNLSVTNIAVSSDTDQYSYLGELFTNTGNKHTTDTTLTSAQKLQTDKKVARE